MKTTLAQYFEEFSNEIKADAEVDNVSSNEEFVQKVSEKLVDAGIVPDFQYCHYRAQRGIRVDGYDLSDDEDDQILSLFISDFESRPTLEPLTQTDINQNFRRLENFFSLSAEKSLWQEMEMSNPGYDLARHIENKINAIRKVTLFLLSERMLSDRVKELPQKEICGKTVNYQIWDISQIYNQFETGGQSEPILIDFKKDYGQSIPCLKATLSKGSFPSYLVVMPGTLLADLYDKYDTHLLEGNVRTFLQARGKVNKGIRSTIMNEPDRFFAYNNGITATAQDIELENTNEGLKIRSILDLQIVNGGQTTASLFHTRRKDNVSLEQVFVQMKLSIIDPEHSEEVVPKISEYANTQNKINAADFFANAPFHLRMEEISRRLWGPIPAGKARGTKWFYERSRGRYAEAQSKLSVTQQKKFLAEYPKNQLITKEDLAKYENVWDEDPKWVNLGRQKNFVQYAVRIGKEWEKDPDNFNELYFQRAVARAILFRTTEKLVNSQPWYTAGGIRANIVYYTLASIGELAKEKGKLFPFDIVWQKQSVPEFFCDVIAITSKFVNDEITDLPSGFTNVTEWCKRDLCWTNLKSHFNKLKNLLAECTDFWNSLESKEDSNAKKKAGKKMQKIDNGIEAQKKVFSINAVVWKDIRTRLSMKGLLQPKEDGVLKVASQIPNKVPTEKQCFLLLNILEKAKEEGIKTGL